jgi:hypothetical protein
MTMQQQYTLNRPKIRSALKFVNSLIKLERSIGLRIWELDRNAIFDKVKRKTGLNNLGNDKYIEVLDRLIDNSRKVEITPIGECFISYIVQKTAMNRLYIEDYIGKHPEVEDIPIESPIFIVGFPRTGTTLLQNVLSVGGDYRALYLWELVTPYPLHENKEIDRRMRMNRVDLPLRLFKIAVPELAIVHDVKIDSKEECWLLKANTLVIMDSDIGTGLHEWNNWLNTQDRSWVYSEYKRMLQIQSYLIPTKRFVLKCPTHLRDLKLILKIFPDACIVWTHRNPINSIASTSSLMCFVKRFFSGRIGDQKQVGELVMARFHSIVKEAMKFRNYISDSQFFDINFETLIKNIPKAVEDIREHFRLPHRQEHDMAVGEFLDKSQKGKIGKHRYSLKQFSLDPQEIVNRFGDYIERFEIKRN